MASRVKKIFHRKSQSLSQPEPLQSENGHTGEVGDPTLRATPYDATAPGGLPETGAYPIRADGSSTAMHENLPSNYNRGQQGARNDLTYPSSSSNQPSALRESHPNVDPRIDLTHSGSSNVAQSNALPVRDRTGGRDLPSETPLAQDLSRLNLSDGDARANQTPPGGSFPAPNRLNASYPEQRAATPRASPNKVVGPDNSPQPYNSPTTRGYTPGHDTRERLSNEFQDDTDLRRRTSIPRKQVGSSPKAPYSDSTSPTMPHASPGYGPRASIEKSLPSAPASSYNPHRPGRRDDLVQASSVLDRSRPIARSTAGEGAYAAQDIVQRAQHDSADTEVIERIAPAVVHENVQQPVHHLREEVITREIHDHDVYHRILPVIDVEVLPPRHFLPVEGGGLVEISSSEVPGRGKNWVIAETASKIPSDQPAPTVPTRFSVREFPGTEGDMRRYETPEGFERTEQIWVHPPELETGGRDSGQTWPMEFGNAVPGKHHGMRLSGTLHKTKGHRKTLSKNSAPLTGADQPGRVL